MNDDNKNIFIIDNFAKLQWACRRGMLELDVLLGNFLNEAYLSLPSTDKQRFVQLLTYSDPELFSWLLGSESPQEKDIAHITELIRSHARSRL